MQIVVYAFIGVIEGVFGFILQYLPLYFVGKLVFLLWLYLPMSRGADKIYEICITPLFKEYETTIDDTVRKIDKSMVKEKRK